jgi:putative SOS response-associated peptidase YedK
VSNRYSLCASADQLQDRFSVEVPVGYKPTFNAAPGQLLPVITNTGPQGISFFYWGLAPLWAKNKPISEKFFNVHSEIISEKASLRKKLQLQRCLIPADGFYDWKKIGKKTAIPYRYLLPDKKLFSFAGLWEEYEDEGENFHTFAIITLAAGPSLNAMSERIPAILNPAMEKIWLSNTASEDEWLTVLRPNEFSKMDYYTISPRINSLTVNDSGLITPTPPTDQFGNLTLFD